MTNGSYDNDRAARILIVEDEQAIRGAFVDILEKSGYYCRTAGDGREALLALAKNNFDLILSDLRMPRMDGLELLIETGNMNRKITTIVISAHDDIKLAVEATRLGAYDFLSKPVDGHRLRLAVARALEHQRLVLQNRKMARRLAHPSIFPNLIGQSPIMMDVFRVIGQVAPLQTNVLISGESGTGKEQVAQIIHDQSSRKGKRFIVVNCAALPENLVESTLFGHKRGSFTGADRDHAGLLGYSDGGTVFFDEIGELPLSSQVKLLRVIQERSFMPIGSDREVSVDIRIIAATNRNLKTEVREGRFREDLFYRLDVIPILMPPLRERGQDIETLAFHFLDEFSEQFPHVTGFTKEAIDCMQTYEWPGNVRELQNAVERALSLTTNKMIERRDLPAAVGQTRPLPNTYLSTSPHDALEDLKTLHRDYFSRLMNLHEGVVLHAANHAGLSRKVLYRMLKDVGLDPETFRKKT